MPGEGGRGRGQGVRAGKGEEEGQEEEEVQALQDWDEAPDDTMPFPKAQDTTSSSAAPLPAPGIAPGSFVMLWGLQKMTELNGTKGQVQEWLSDVGRYSIEVLDTGRLFSLKVENLNVIGSLPLALSPSLRCK